MVGGETDKEDEDGAANQLPDPGFLVGLRPSTAAHSSQHTQVADL